MRVPVSVPRFLTQIAYRRVNNPVIPGAYHSQPITLDIELWASTAPHPPHAISHHRLENRGPDLQRVLGRTLVTFPGVPYQASGTYPFNFVLAFERPFLVRSDSIMIERILHAQPGTGWVPDPGIELFFDEDPDSRYRPRSYGQQCPYPWGSAVLSSGIRLGGLSHYYVTSRRPVQARREIVLVGFGVRTDFWLGMPLPLDLGFVGAPGCTLYFAPMVFVPVAMPFGHAVGSGFLPLRIPEDRALSDIEIHYQALQLFDGMPAQPGYEISTSLAHAARVQGDPSWIEVTSLGRDANPSGPFPPEVEVPLVSGGFVMELTFLP